MDKNLFPHVNNSDKPLIFLGSNSIMEKYTEICEENGIHIHGIIDSDYYGNTDQISGITIIDSEEVFNDIKKLTYYKSTFNFFCATNWTPFLDSISIRNKEKRQKLIKLIKQHDLNCISIIDTFSTRVFKSTKIGYGVYIDGHVNLEPRVTIGNFTNLYSHTLIGHDSIIGENCVFQRMASLASNCIVEDEVYAGLSAKLFKNNSTFSKGSFIHEGIYLRRGTLPEEIVSMTSKNQKRVANYIIN